MLIVDGFCRNYNERTNYNKKGSDENRKIRVVPVPEKVFSQLVGSLKDTKTYVNYVFDKKIVKLILSETFRSSKNTYYTEIIQASL